MRGLVAEPPLAGAGTVQVKDAGFEAVLEGVGGERRGGDGVGKAQHALRAANGAGLGLDGKDWPDAAGVELGVDDPAGHGGVSGAGGLSRSSGRAGMGRAGVDRMGLDRIGMDRAGIDGQFVTLDTYFHSSSSFHAPSGVGPVGKADGCGIPRGLAGRSRSYFPRFRSRAWSRVWSEDRTGDWATISQCSQESCFISPGPRP